MSFGRLNKFIATALAIGTLSIANAGNTNLQHRAKKKLQPYAAYIGIETSKTSSARVSYAQSLENAKQCSIAKMSLADFYAFAGVPVYARGYLKEIKSSQRPQDSLEKIALAFRIDLTRGNSPNKVQTSQSVQNKINIVEQNAVDSVDAVAYCAGHVLKSSNAAQIQNSADDRFSIEYAMRVNSTAVNNVNSVNTNNSVSSNSQAAMPKDLRCSRIGDGVFAQELLAKSQMNYVENAYSTTAARSKEESIRAESVDVENKNAVETVKSKDSSIETVCKSPHVGLRQYSNSSIKLISELNNGNAAADSMSQSAGVDSKSAEYTIENRRSSSRISNKDIEQKFIESTSTVRGIDASMLNRRGASLVVLEDSKDILPKFNPVAPIDVLDGEVQSKKSNYSVEPYRAKDIRQMATSAEVKELSKWNSLLIGYEGDWLSLPWQYYFRSQHLLLRGQNDDREFAALQKYIERQFDRYESLETNKYCIAWSISSKGSRLDGRSQAIYGMKNTLDSLKRLLIKDVPNRTGFKLKDDSVEKVVQQMKKNIEIGKKLKIKRYMSNKMLLTVEILQM